MSAILLENGDLPKRPEFADDFRIVRQRLEARLRTHEGDWPLDTSVGLPWVEWLRDKTADVDAIGSVVRRTILQVDGVAEVREFDARRESGVLEFSGTIVAEDPDEVAELELTFEPQVRNAHPIITIQAVR